MKHIARFNKVWQDKRTGKMHGREIELPENDNISNYTMVAEPKKAVSHTATPEPKKRNAFDGDEKGE